jgi:hypothetical protein
MKNKNNGYEYDILLDDPQGTFVEVWQTDDSGERLGLHLTIFVNSDEGESIKDAVAATEIELNDHDAPFNDSDLKMQKDALSWFKIAYNSAMNAS